MLENDTLKNGTSRTGLYENAPPPGTFMRMHIVNSYRVKTGDHYGNFLFPLLVFSTLGRYHEYTGGIS